MEKRKFNKRGLDLEDRTIYPYMEGLTTEYDPILVWNHPEYMPFPICGRGDTVLVYGPEGCRKTTTMRTLGSCFLGGRIDHLHFEAHLRDDESVLYIATEESPEETLEGVRMIHDWLGLLNLGIESPRFRAVNVKGMQPTKKMELIWEAVLKYKPTVMIVDHVGDLALDDTRPGASEIILQFERMQVETGVTLFAVTHTNREGKNSYGHTGAAFDKKAVAKIKLWLNMKTNATHVVSTKVRKGLRFFQFVFDQDVCTKEPQFGSIVRDDYFEALGDKLLIDAEDLWDKEVASIKNKAHAPAAKSFAAQIFGEEDEALEEPDVPSEMEDEEPEDWALEEEEEPEWEDSPEEVSLFD